MDGHEAELRASDAARKREDLSWGKFAKRFNRYLEVMEALFWPNLFIVGGGISKNREKYLPLLTIGTPVVPAQMLNEAGIIWRSTGCRKE